MPRDIRVPPAAGQSPAKGQKHLGRIGDYELLRVIGRGGMGIVYEAKQCSLNRTVAIKRILSGAAADPEEIQRFRTQIADLRTRADQRWLTQQRARAIRGLVEEVLTDADSRMSLLSTGMTAGHDKEFFIAGAGGAFHLGISGQI